MERGFLSKETVVKTGPALCEKWINPHYSVDGDLSSGYLYLLFVIPHPVYMYMRNKIKLTT